MKSNKREAQKRKEVALAKKLAQKSNQVNANHNQASNIDVHKSGLPEAADSKKICLKPQCQIHTLLSYPSPMIQCAGPPATDEQRCNIATKDHNHVCLIFWCNFVNGDFYLIITNVL